MGACTACLELEFDPRRSRAGDCGGVGKVKLDRRSGCGWCTELRESDLVSGVNGGVLDAKPFLDRYSLFRTLGAADSDKAAP